MSRLSIEIELQKLSEEKEPEVSDLYLQNTTPRASCKTRLLKSQNQGEHEKSPEF